MLEESLLYFAKSFGGLMFLNKNDYAPAQKMLTLMNQDLRKAEHFLKEYNDKKLTPVPLPEGHLQNSVQRIRDILVNGISAAINEVDVHSHSIFFHESLNQLTNGLRLLKILEERDYEPVKKFRNNFKERMAELMRQSSVTVYPLSEEQSQKCEMIFTNYFSSGDKKSH